MYILLFSLLVTLVLANTNVRVIVDDKNAIENVRKQLQNLGKVEHTAVVTPY